MQLFHLFLSTRTDVFAPTIKPLQETTTRLRTYLGEQMMILGQLDVEVQYGAQRAHLPLCVVHGKGSSLLG